jgi:hypothetical protein
VREVGTGVDMVLGHLKDRRFLFFGVGVRQTIDYDTFRVVGARPESDKVLLAVHCPTCDRELWLRIDSVELTRRRRRVRLLTALVAASVAAFTILVGVVDDYLGEPEPLSTPLGVTLLLAFLLGGLAAGVAGYLWWKQDGIRLYTPTAESSDLHRRLDSWEPGSDII